MQGGKRNTRNPGGREQRSCQALTIVTDRAADAPLFHVPRGLVTILDRDLAVAGIAKTDDRGRMETQRNWSVRADTHYPQKDEKTP